MSMNWEQHFRQMSQRPFSHITKAQFGDDVDTSGIGPIESGIGGALTIKDNLDALQSFFATAIPATLQAAQVKDEFTRWFNELSWYEKYTQSTYDLARNIRNRYDLANVTTPVARQAVQEVIKTGLTSEQLAGQTDRRDSQGNFPGPTTPPKSPLVPWWVWAGAAGVASLSVLVFSYGKATHVLR